MTQASQKIFALRLDFISVNNPQITKSNAKLTLLCGNLLIQAKLLVAYLLFQYNELSSRFITFLNLYYHLLTSL